MTPYELPFQARAETFNIDLGARTVRLTTRFCPPSESWLLDIDETDGTPLLRGLPLVTGVDMLGQHKHLGLGGELRVQSVPNLDIVPDYDALGTTGFVFFVVP